MKEECQLANLLEYHDVLAPVYGDELIKLYIPALEKHGLTTNNRSQYADLVQKMERIMRSMPQGKMQILAVAQRLRERFSHKPKRPAMLQELDRLLKKQ